MEIRNCEPYQKTPECHDVVSEEFPYQLDADEVAKTCEITKEESINELEAKLINCAINNQRKDGFKFAPSLLSAVASQTSYEEIRKFSELVLSYLEPKLQIESIYIDSKEDGWYERWSGYVSAIWYCADGYNICYKALEKAGSVDNYFPYKSLL